MFVCLLILSHCSTSEKHYTGTNRTIQLLRRQMNLYLEMMNESRKNKIVREFVFFEVFSQLFLYFTKTLGSASGEQILHCMI